MMLRRALLAAALAMSAAVAAGRERIPGEYGLFIGNAACPGQVRVDRTALLHAGACAPNKTAMEFFEADEVVGNQLTLHLKGGEDAKKASVSRKFGEFQVARVSRNFTCLNGSAAVTFEKGMYLNLFVPKENVLINFTDVFSWPPPKEEAKDGAKGLGNEHRVEAGAAASAGGAPAAPCAAGVACQNETNALEEPSPTPLPFIGIAGTGGEGNTLQLKEGQSFLAVDRNCLYVQTKRAECLPASAIVRVHGSGAVRVDAVQLGDKLAVGAGTYSPLFMWTHRDADALSLFVRAETARGALTVTPGHYVYANAGLSPARQLRVGDLLTAADGTEARIDKVQLVWLRGLYNPQTLAGDVVVDGFVVSTYTEAVRPSAAHALLAPLRMVTGVLDEWRESIWMYA